MSRKLILALLALGLGYWAFSLWHDHVESENRMAAREAKRRNENALVSSMAAKSDAATTWAANLARDSRLRTSPILTSELQNQWLINRPILFLGNLEDIAKIQDGSYQLIIEHGSVDSPYIFLQSRIRVNLSCSETVTAPLMHAAAGRETFKLGPDTAVTAIIDRIDRTTARDSEGDLIAVLTGYGKCISAMALSE